MIPGPPAPTPAAYDAPMRVAFIAAECEPYAKTGGLGDVVDALARAVGRGGAATVDVYLPRYRGVPVPAGAVRATSRLVVPDPTLPGGTNEVGLIDLAADGYRLRLVDHPAAFDRDGYYGDAGGDFADNAWRFGLLCRAALEAIRRDGGTDVLHLHDWHACPAVLLRSGPYRSDPGLGPAATLLTLHNLAFHGWVPADRVWLLGLDRGPLGGVPGGWPEGLAVEPGVDLLRAGIERAHLVNTVSPTFAAEALRPEYGMGLDALLRERGDRFFGILNGIDPAVWNPASDPELAAPYTAEALAGKAVCRADLLARVGLEPADPGPVLGAIGRLDPQKGFDLLAAAAPALVEAGARLVVQANGDPAIAEPLRVLAASAPSQVAFIERFDRAMARRIYAGADLFVMPSRFEPSGQGQMIALRYGTPPIVRRTGGLADSVVDVDESPGAGTGFAFGPAEAEALVEACRRAIAFRGDGRGDAWLGLVRRAMATDFSWEAGAARAYGAAYERALRIASDGG
jgi:starch synthase